MTGWLSPGIGQGDTGLSVIGPGLTTVSGSWTRRKQLDTCFCGQSGGVLVGPPSPPPKKPGGLLNNNLMVTWP